MTTPGSVLVIQHEEYAPPALVAEVAADLGLEIEVLVTERGEQVPRSLDHDALVVLGGDEFVRDAPTHTHLRDEMDLITYAHAHERPVLGICLGAQLAAAALGGAAVKGAHGIEIGWERVRPTEAGAHDPLGASLGDGDDLFLWHSDAVVAPPGAQLILTADRYPVQGFRLGSVTAVQSHPEVDHDTVVAWCNLPGADRELRVVGTSADELVAGIDRRQEAGRRLLQAWCSEVVEVSSQRL